MALIQYVLKPLSAFHFGTGREEDSADVEALPRSDTLASAILSVWRHADPQKSDGDVETLAADPPFALSSAVPALEHRGILDALLFVPPGLAERVAVDDLMLKRYRKSRFAQVTALRSMLRREPLPADAFLISDSGALLNPDPPPQLDGDQRVDEIWQQRLWLRESRPRLAIDRMTGTGADGMLFRYASTVFRSDVLLMILAEFRDPSCRPVFETALRLLGAEGIGGGRSIGHGRFAVQQIVDGFDPELGTDARMLLSLCHPTRAEITNGLLNSPSAYALVARGGWAQSGGAGAARRKAVNMLAEGSVVRDLGTARYGESVCVLPSGRLPHTVYRSGCAVTVPIAWSDK